MTGPHRAHPSDRPRPRRVRPSSLDRPAGAARDVGFATAWRSPHPSSAAARRWCPGKLIGSPAATRAARKPKHCASSASPSQPTASTGSTGTPSASRSAAMIAGLCRPPPVTSQRRGGAGSGAQRDRPAVKATSVAAPSAGDSASRPLAASAAAKSSRSSDFGAGRAKYGWPSSAASTGRIRTRRRGPAAPSRSKRAAGVARHPVVQRAVAGAGVERDQCVARPTRSRSHSPPRRGSAPPAASADRAPGRHGTRGRAAPPARPPRRRPSGNPTPPARRSARQVPARCRSARSAGSGWCRMVWPWKPIRSAAPPECGDRADVVLGQPRLAVFRRRSAGSSVGARSRMRRRSARSRSS